jgi:hypothetical protein
MKPSAVLVLAAAFVLFAIVPAAVHAQFAAAPLAASSVPTDQLIQPADLNKLLTAPAAARPLILQVGSKLMFDQAHIPGSEYAGPGSRPEGLNLLSDRVKSLAKNKFIVLYCGCCPWGRCPNVGNAFKLLHDRGFTNVKVVYMADNFGANWVTPGYPVAQ